ncbi:hypothetical protein PFTANZ_04355 [Plasmodium falciparum Tanzania (2000708)]|uniref:Telomerase reverse transcriptase n=2 Tax=Plasmodium falciparum TaxID=5833 RepID=A0A024W344_PLAFA|nr:hypothetical protein PFTANZ_04355 [Plasmodium falciparum Tanzania (2000708)]ETW59888.1 hypothetical protein PFMC_04350 [Plasmodium falciparum CAMP/Malaysia]
MNNEPTNNDKNYLKNIFNCTDKKIILFKSYLKNKLDIDSFTLGEYCFKHDEKFQRSVLSNILKEQIISKKDKNKLHLINEIIIDTSFFKENYDFQYFLENVLLLEDLVLKKLDNKLNDEDFIFKENKKVSINNWKECYSHIKKKLNIKGMDEKSKIYNNSILLFNSTKFSYDDINCCDSFYGLKVWDILFNYVSFDFLNYLLSNTLIFISDYFFINTNNNFKTYVKSSYFIKIAEIQLNYQDAQNIERNIFSKKKNLYYKNTKLVKLTYQKKSIKDSTTPNLTIQKKKKKKKKKIQ